jgi:hypothetical protein
VGKFEREAGLNENICSISEPYPLYKIIIIFGVVCCASLSESYN